VQIAEELGISVKTVEYRITQTLKILRVKLKDYLS
jgi:RNA polymerase sigma-70 factor (ECF subfamily)